MTSPDKQEAKEAYEQNVQAVCDTYQQAPSLQQQGGHVVSVDEKTGIQAIERKHPKLVAQPGQLERMEFEYIRHGTLTLIASFDVVTGEIDATIGAHRTEDDFVQHIEQIITQDPKARWIFVCDQLNTHMSESLVQFIASWCELDDELGVKGKRGILKSKESRKKWLSDESHPIRFVYTPRHCSWLNQVEIWFSVLSRRLLKRASFCCLDDLRKRLFDFIDYFNRVLAKPYRWTYTGRPLVA